MSDRLIPFASHREKLKHSVLTRNSSEPSSNTPPSSALLLTTVTPSPARSLGDNLQLLAALDPDLLDAINDVVSDWIAELTDIAQQTSRLCQAFVVIGMASALM